MHLTTAHFRRTMGVQLTVAEPPAMPRSKNPDHYPRQYVEICEQCAVRGTQFVLEFGTVREGLRVQQSFIAFVAAIGRIRDKVGERKPSDYERHWLELLPLAYRTQAWLQRHEDGSATLTFHNRDEGPFAAKLREAKVIPGSGMAPPVVDDDDMFARLLLEQEQVRPGAGPAGVTVASDNKITSNVQEKLSEYGYRGSGSATKREGD